MLTYKKLRHTNFLEFSNYQISKPPPTFLLTKCAFENAAERSRCVFYFSEAPGRQTAEKALPYFGFFCYNNRIYMDFPAKKRS